MVAAREHGCARRRAERRGMKAVVLESLCCESLCVWRLAWTTERARRAESDIIEQDHQHVWCASWRAQRRDRRKLGVRILGVVRGEAHRFTVRNRQHAALNRIL